MVDPKGVLCRRGYRTHTDRHANWILSGSHRGFIHGLPQSLSDGENARTITVLTHDQEFLAAIPSDEVIAPDRSCQPFRHLPKNHVSSKMTASVVDGFEVVDIHHHHAQRFPGSLLTLHLFLQKLEDCHPIPKPCERVVG